MARRRKPLPDWATAKGDGIEQRFIQIGNSLMYHPAWNKLSPNAVRVYIHMMLESGGKIQFTMPHRVYSQFVSGPAFQRAKAELIEAGFILEEKNGKGTRSDSVYKFCFEWKKKLL